MFVKLAAAFFVSLAVSAAVGYKLVPMLRRIKAGQMIREDGPVWHNSKQGTPTMGGALFAAGILASCLTVGLSEIGSGDFGHIIVLCFSLLCAGIGFLDDYRKLRKKRNLGLTAKHKFALQTIAAVAFVLVMRLTGSSLPQLHIPFFGVTYSIHEIPYFIFSVFVVVGTINAVNITDGIDGLATGVSIPVALFYVSVAAVWGLASLGVFAAALAGGLAAFLMFNFYPAKVFMGDTGSLFLGGAISAMAFAIGLPLILLPLGIVFFVETLSDLIQISYFKISKGKRVFKMAPLHHHFEMCGWSEYKIFAVFSTVSAIFAAVSYLGAVKQ